MILSISIIIKFPEKIHDNKIRAACKTLSLSSFSRLQSKKKDREINRVILKIEIF
jgi:hypothetical protein